MYQRRRHLYLLANFQLKLVLYNVNRCLGTKCLYTAHTHKVRSRSSRERVGQAAEFLLDATAQHRCCPLPFRNIPHPHPQASDAFRACICKATRPIRLA